MTMRGRSILTLLAAGPKLTRQLGSEIGITNEAAAHALKNLKKRGLIISREGVHEITDKGREVLASGREVAGPQMIQSRRGNTLRSRVWYAIRVQDYFAAEDLLGMIGTEKDAHALPSIKRYLRALCKAGYLAVSKRDKGRYRLRKEAYTGPEAPALNAANKTVVDHNTGAVVYLDGVQE